MTTSKKMAQATAAEVDSRPDAVDQGEKLEVTLPIGDATRDQLEIFAMKYLGLEVEMNDGADVIRGKMLEVGYILPFITYERIVKSQRGPVMSGGDDGLRVNKRSHPEQEGVFQVRIMIPFSASPGGKDPVPVGVNGSCIYLQRNTPIWVSEKFVEALINAVEYQFLEYDVERNLMGGLEAPNKVPSYPFGYV